MATRYEHIITAHYLTGAAKAVFAGITAFIALMTAFVLVVTGVHTLSAVFGLIFVAAAGYALYEVDQVV